MNSRKTHPPSPGTGGNTFIPADIRSVINTFIYHRDLFHKIIDIEVITRPEWKTLKVIRANTEYILLDNHHMVIHSPYFDRVITELHRHLADPTA